MYAVIRKNQSLMIIKSYKMLFRSRFKCSNFNVTKKYIFFSKNLVGTPVSNSLNLSMNLFINEHVIYSVIHTIQIVIYIRTALVYAHAITQI